MGGALRKIIFFILFSGCTQKKSVIRKLVSPLRSSLKPKIRVQNPKYKPNYLLVSSLADYPTRPVTPACNISSLLLFVQSQLAFEYLRCRRIPQIQIPSSFYVFSPSNLGSKLGALFLSRGFNLGAKLVRLRTLMPQPPFLSIFALISFQ